MLQQGPLIFALQLTGAILAFGTAVLAWQKRKTQGAGVLIALMLTSSVWGLISAFKFSIPDGNFQLINLKLETMGMAIAPTLYLFFALEYTRQDKLLFKRRSLLLWIIPWLTILLAVTNEGHTNFWQAYQIDPQTGVLRTIPGELFIFFIVYYYSIRLVGTLILIWASFRYPAAHRMQFWTLLTCALTPWISNAIYFNFGWIGLFDSLEIHALGYTVTGVAFGWGILRYKLLDIVPLARDSILEGLVNGIVVLDTKKNVIDANQSARTLFKQTQLAIGKPFDDPYRQLTKTTFSPDDDSQIEISIGKVDIRYIDIRTRSLKDDRQRLRGYIVTFQDNTHSRQIQNELQSQRDFALLVMNTMGQGLSVTNEHLEFEYVNPAYARLLETTPEELIGHTPLEFTIEHDVISAAHEKRLRGETNSYETHLRSTSGRIIDVQVTGVPRVRDGKVIGTIAVITDLTERTKAEDEIRRSRAQLTAMFDNAGVGIWVTGTDDIYSFVNNQMATMLGYRKEELIGQNRYKFIQPYDVYINQGLQEELFNGNISEYTNENRYIHKDGHIIWGSLSATCIRNERDEVEMVVGFVADTSKRREAEDALRETERRFRDILNDVNLITVMIDQNANITYCNDHMLEVSGWRREEIVGESWFEIFEPNNLAPQEHFIRALQRGAILRHHENSITLRNGDTISVSWNNIIMRDKDNKVSGMASLGEDITARRKAEKAEREQRNFAEALSRVAGEMNEGLDLQNTLQQILSNIGQVVPHDAANIALIEKKEVIFVRARGYETLGTENKQVESMRLSLKSIPNLMQATITKKPLLVRDSRRDPKWVALDPTRWIMSHISTPIIVEGKVLGFINVDSATPGYFNEEHVHRLEAFSAQAAIAFKNAQLYDQSQKELKERRLTQVNLRRANKRLQTQLAEIEALQAQLRQQAIRDPLTGLFNRRYLEETLSREVSRAEREHLPLSIIMMDIDKFKSVNDTYGHAAGDMMLKALGKLLAAETRRADVACRYGGEEFCIILPGAPTAIAIQRAEQMRMKFSQLLVPTEDATLRGTLSLGVATFPDHGQTGDDVVKAADGALYCAKTNGRNRVEIALQ